MNDNVRGSCGLLKAPPPEQLFFGNEKIIAETKPNYPCKTGHQNQEEDCKGKSDLARHCSLTVPPVYLVRQIRQAFWLKDATKGSVGDDKTWTKGQLSFHKRISRFTILQPSRSCTAPYHRRQRDVLAVTRA
jgi:hypothetical protein